MTRQLLIITSILLIISACGQNSFERTKDKNSVMVSVNILNTYQDTIPPKDNLKIVRQFAEEFSPDTTTQNGLSKMNDFPDSIVKAFKELRLDLKNQEKYLTLIYLKVYRGHLQCCHQSYELRKKTNIKGIDSVADPLLFEYNFITKQFDNKRRIEMITSGIADIWV